MAAPTVAGFEVFVRSVMGINDQALPVGAPILTYAFSVALAIVNKQLVAVGGGIPGGWTIYELAVYNFAGDRLVNFAPDNPDATATTNPTRTAAQNQVYFTTLRTSMRLTSFVAGVVSATYDQGTGESMVVPDYMKELTLRDLAMLKTPWGRAYLEIAQDAGSLWGMS